MVMSFPHPDVVGVESKSLADESGSWISPALWMALRVHRRWLGLCMPQGAQEAAVSVEALWST
eukprot:949568-Prorocentrum_lima.AAC.1